MSREEDLAYQKGYAAGRRNQWPAHMPPKPPDEITQIILLQGRHLRDTADTLQAGFDEDDEGLDPLRLAIEGYDNAVAVITEWLSKTKVEVA